MRKKKIFPILFVCVLICFIALYGCKQTKSDPEKVIVPKDFTFSITWDCYGISSYDSGTGTLIKTNHATHPEDYITTLELSEDVLKEIYIKLTEDMDIYSYHNNYNPFSYDSRPTETIIISMTADGKSKTVTCENIAFGDPEDAKNKKGQKFIYVKNEIVNMITNTEEWQSLPDYEFGYD